MDTDAEAINAAIEKLPERGMAALFPLVDRRWWWLGSQEVADVAERAVNAHNAGKVNLGDFFLGLDPRDDDERKDANSAGVLFWAILPRFIESPERLQLMLSQLSQRNMIGPETHWGESLKTWLRHDSTRSEAFIALTKADLTASVFGIFEALVAGGLSDPGRYCAEAIELASDPRSNVRRSALVALSHITMPTDDVMHLVIPRLITACCDGNSPEDHYFALSSLLRLLADPRLSDQENALDLLVEGAAGVDRTTVRNAAANALCNFGSGLSPPVVQKILEWLSETTQSEADTFRMLDGALYKLMGVGKITVALEFAAAYLARNPHLSIDAMGSFAHGVAYNRAHFSAIVLYWLKDGRPVLCAAVQHLLTQQGEDNFRLDYDLTEIGVSSEERVRLGRRAVGYLLHLPLATASIVLAAMRGAEPMTRRALGQLLLDPLLMNYSGDTYDYLKALQPSELGDVASDLLEILQAFETYRDALNGLTRIRELEPPESHRFIAQQQWADEMDKVEEEGKYRSSVADIFTKKTILFGNKAVVHVYPSMTLPPVRSIMAFQTISHVQELPKSSVLDPVRQMYDSGGYRFADSEK